MLDHREFTKRVFRKAGRNNERVYLPEQDRDYFVAVLMDNANHYGGRIHEWNFYLPIMIKDKWSAERIQETEQSIEAAHAFFAELRQIHERGEVTDFEYRLMTNYYIRDYDNQLSNEEKNHKQRHIKEIGHYIPSKHRDDNGVTYYRLYAGLPCIDRYLIQLPDDSHRDFQPVLNGKLQPAWTGVNTRICEPDYDCPFCQDVDWEARGRIE